MTYNERDLGQARANGYNEGVKDTILSIVLGLIGIALLIVVLAVTVGK